MSERGRETLNLLASELSCSRNRQLWIARHGTKRRDTMYKPIKKVLDIVSLNWYVSRQRTHIIGNQLAFVLELRVVLRE